MTEIRVHVSSGSRQQDKKMLFAAATRVARWYIFKPKIQIWVNFKGL
jgi:hypothetical protein